MMADADGCSESKFHYEVRRIQYDSRDEVLTRYGNPDPKNRLYLEVRYGGTLLPDLLDLQSFRVNAHDEIRDIISCLQVPDSLVSDKSLLDSVVTAVLAATEEEEKSGVDVIQLRVDITNSDQSEELVVCSICLEDIEDGEAEEPECGHGYHQDCIFKWLEDNDSCPMCRFEIDLESY